jgi:hypothetical protein
MSEEMMYQVYVRQNGSEKTGERQPGQYNFDAAVREAATVLKKQLVVGNDKGSVTLYPIVGDGRGIQFRLSAKLIVGKARKEEEK